MISILARPARFPPPGRSGFLVVASATRSLLARKRRGSGLAVYLSVPFAGLLLAMGDVREGGGQPPYSIGVSRSVSMSAGRLRLAATTSPRETVWSPASILPATRHSRWAKVSSKSGAPVSPVV